jgi:filamentous hemagglutinin family protein
MRLQSLVLVSLIAAAVPAWSNPTGPVVVSGTANFSTSGGTLTVTNSQNAIINWQQFNVAAGETVRFNQPSSASMVLNRVVTAAPSSILGTLSSNGGVFLVTPSGGIFGGQVQTNVFSISTQDISNANFVAGNYVYVPHVGSVAGSFTVTGTTTLGGGTITTTGTVTVTGGTTTVTGGTTLISDSVFVTTGLVTVSGGNTTTSDTLSGGGSAAKVSIPFPGAFIGRISPAFPRISSVASSGNPPASIALSLEKRNLEF